MSTLAAIDCGTNSTRILIVDDNGKELARDLRITRLGQGVDSSRKLAPEAIGRTVEAAAEFKKLIDQFGVDKMRVVATSAARDASNSSDLFDALHNVLGVEPELLDGTEEGRLTFAGATASLEEPPYLVIDIGGGSTEYVLGTEDGKLFTTSTDMGCVRMTEQFLSSDPSTPGEIEAAINHVDHWLRDVETLLPIKKAKPSLVGVAGTVTSLAAIDLELTSYDPWRTHGYLFTQSGIGRITKALSAQTIEQRMANPFLPPGRADVILAGAIILLTSMKHFEFDVCRVSETDILDGLIFSITT